MSARHLILVNVARHGYTLFAGDKGSFESQPHGEVSAVVSREMLDAHRVLRETLSAGASLSTLWMGCGGGGGVVVAYGCRFPEVPDDKGRRGLQLLHAIAVDDVLQLPVYVEAVLIRLGAAQRARIEREVAACAARGLAESFVALLARKVDEHIDRSGTSPEPGESPLSPSVIVHDHVGAEAIAWMTFAHVARTKAPPWTVRDQRVQGAIRTAIEPHQGEVVAASELLRAGVGHLMSAPTPWSLHVHEEEREDEGPVLALRPPTPPVEQKTTRASRWVIAGGIVLAASALVTASMLCSREPSREAAVAPASDHPRVGFDLAREAGVRADAVAVGEDAALASDVAVVEQDLRMPSPLDAVVRRPLPQQPHPSVTWTHDNSVR